MTVRSWEKKTQDSRTLTVFRGPGFDGGAWAPVFDLSITAFNDIMKANSLSLTMTKATSAADANIIVEAASKQASINFEGATMSKAFDGNGLHGAMFPVSDGDGKVVKGFIFVPATPKADRNDKKSREVGQEVRRFILVHEMIHAAGLSNDEHTLDDLMCFPAEISLGNTAADDRLQPWGGLGKPMPPFYISSKTCTNIKKAWP